VSGRVSMTIAGILNVRAKQRGRVPVGHRAHPARPQGPHALVDGRRRRALHLAHTKQPAGGVEAREYLCDDASRSASSEVGDVRPGAVQRAKSAARPRISSPLRPPAARRAIITSSTVLPGRRLPRRVPESYQRIRSGHPQRLDLVWRDVRRSPAEACRKIDVEVDKIIEKNYRGMTNDQTPITNQ